MKRTTRSTRRSMKERNHQTTKPQKPPKQPGRKPVLWVECFFPKIEIWAQHRTESGNSLACPRCSNRPSMTMTSPEFFLPTGTWRRGVLQVGKRRAENAHLYTLHIIYVCTANSFTYHILYIQFLYLCWMFWSGSCLLPTPTIWRVPNESPSTGDWNIVRFNRRQI